jgi:hypothetical protein
MTSVERLVDLLHAKRNGNGWQAKCPAHEDHQPSLSIHEGADGRVLLKCFAGCATVNIVAAVGLTMRDLFPARSRTQPGKAVPAVKNGTAAFDFHAKCVASLNGKDRIRLSNERWLSRSFCKWLDENGYVGIWHGDFAFPVEDHGHIVAAHYRVKSEQIGAKDVWYYHPKGVNVQPFVIGDLTKAKQVHIGESPWDILALADRTDLYLNEHHAFVATRGASNAALCKDLIPEGVSVLAWPQNDKAGEKWLTDLCACLSVSVANAVVPSQFKDVNEWTKAGASAQDIYLAMFKNELVEKPEIAEPAVSSAGTDADEETLQRLAVLPPLEYERVRKAEAKKLGCRRVSMLDRLVNAKRLLSQSASDLQGRTINLPDVEPWPEPVNCAEVLNAVAATLSPVRCVAAWRCTHARPVVRSRLLFFSFSVFATSQRHQSGEVLWQNYAARCHRDPCPQATVYRKPD